MKDTDKDMNPIAEVLELSARQFREAGLDHIAYIKPEGVSLSRTYGIYAANGQKLDEQKSVEAAMILARHNDLSPMMVH